MNSPIGDDYLPNFRTIATRPASSGVRKIFSKVDVNNVVYEFELVRYVLESSTGTRRTIDQPFSSDRDTDQSLFVNFNYQRQIKYPDTVLIGTKVEKLGNSSVTLSHEVFSQSNNAVSATGKSVIVMFDYAAQKSIPIDDDYREIFERFEASVQA